MNILITGVTETHINHPKRAATTKFVSIPELMRKGFSMLDCDIDHRAVKPGENLSAYDKVFVYVYPLDHNATNHEGAVYTLEKRFDAVICLDDWSFQKILPTWQEAIDIRDLTNRAWLAPLFPWGDPKKMDLDVGDIFTWDPSSLYDLPVTHKLPWINRKHEWYNASLSSDAHLWAEAQHLGWPVHSIGGKKLGQPRLLESDIVWQYGGYKGVLCPTYSHAGCGWWRVRYLHSAHAGCILGGSPEELGMIHQSYSYSLHEIEQMDDDALQVVATLQAKNLVSAIATEKQTLDKLRYLLKCS